MSQISENFLEKNSLFEKNKGDKQELKDDVRITKRGRSRLLEIAFYKK